MAKATSTRFALGISLNQPTLTNIVVSEDEVFHLLSSHKTNTSVGPDSSGIMLRNTAVSIFTSLTRIFNLSLLQQLGNYLTLTLYLRPRSLRYVRITDRYLYSSSRPKSWKGSFIIESPNSSPPIISSPTSNLGSGLNPPHKTPFFLSPTLGTTCSLSISVLLPCFSI